jgi:hypothetical protein
VLDAGIAGEPLKTEANLSIFVDFATFAEDLADRYDDAEPI